MLAIAALMLLIDTYIAPQKVSAINTNSIINRQLLMWPSISFRTIIQNGIWRDLFSADPILKEATRFFIVNYALLDCSQNIFDRCHPGHVVSFERQRC